MSLTDYLTNKPELTTVHLLLRQLKATDIPDLYEWMPNPSIYTYWGKRAGKNDLHPETLFATPQRTSKSFHWGIEHLQDNKLIGDLYVYLIENDRQANVAFRISPAYQGKGFAAEALQSVVHFCFNNTQLQRLQAGVDIRNHASYKTLEKAGFVREGHIRQGKMVNTFCDYYIYGLLKPNAR